MLTCTVTVFMAWVSVMQTAPLFVFLPLHGHEESKAEEETLVKVRQGKVILCLLEHVSTDVSAS